jgi:hypothetical protein
VYIASKIVQRCICGSVYAVACLETLLLCPCRHVCLPPTSSGFHDYSLVFLRPSRPSAPMQRLLKAHPMSYRLRYLQGSATSHSVSEALLLVSQLFNAFADAAWVIELCTLCQPASGKRVSEFRLPGCCSLYMCGTRHAVDDSALLLAHSNVQWLLQDLARAQVHHADAVFIMADKSPGDTHEE